MSLYPPISFGKLLYDKVKIWKLNFRDGIDTSPDRVLAKKSKTSLVACLSNPSTRKRTVILNALEVVPS